MKFMTNYRLLLLVFLSAMLMRCTNDPNELEAPQVDQELLLIPRDQIDDQIMESLKATNEFNWRDASDQVLWSALMHSDSTLTIGYQPEGESDVNSRMATIDIKGKNWVQARENVVEEALYIINKGNDQPLESEDIDLRAHNVLPYVEIHITDPAVITRLRSLPNVRYVEPLGYEVDFARYAAEGREESSKGCSNDPDYGIPSGDYTVVAPNAKVSWNYSYMNIPQAWSHSTGSGIAVGLIDTGISPNQTKLNGEFNSGYSSGRYVHKYGFYVSSWWPWDDPDGPNDQCGHGTAMAGTIAAPRSTSGSSVGVAYNANLVAVRGTGDVVINGGSEKTGVSDALVFLGNRSDVKIISMSIGDVFSNSKVADAIRYAYGKGKLIFAAAGTSTSFTNWYGVIFPASMNETVAVTGVKEGSGYQRCDICHSGDKVDFTVVMERSGSGKHALTLAMSGSDPSTVGGSSVATATAAGIAALVWSKNPGWSRDQVLNKMKQSADLYPSRSSEYGWGTLDALAAVN
ncbi:hypothetical protein GCM10009122_16870 [Fulvivirga kasyanovii]